jgi:hypothetical protein
LRFKLQALSSDFDLGVRLNSSRFIGNQATAGAVIHYPCAMPTCLNLDFQSSIELVNNSAVGGDGHFFWLAEVRGVADARAAAHGFTQHQLNNTCVRRAGVRTQPGLFNVTTCAAGEQPNAEKLCPSWLLGQSRRTSNPEVPLIGSASTKLVVEMAATSQSAIAGPRVEGGRLTKPLLSSSIIRMPLGLAVHIQSAANRTLTSGTADATASVIARIHGLEPVAFVGEQGHSIAGQRKFHGMQWHTLCAAVNNQFNATPRHAL